MARLNWVLFCQHHLTDQGGKNSYIGVFDTLTATVRAEPGGTPPQLPLPAPTPSGRFVLAAHITGGPGRPEVELRVMDPDGELIAPPAQLRLNRNDMGRHNLHVNFSHGIPIRRSGIYVFEFIVDGKGAGVAELPVDVRVEEEGEL